MLTMRVMGVVVLLLGIALGVWFWRDRDAPPPLPQDPTENVATAAKEPTAGPQSERLPAAVTPPPPTNVPTESAPAVTAPQPDAPVPPNRFQLQAIDAVTMQPISVWRAMLRRPGGGRQLTGEGGATGTVDIDLPAGTRGDLLVEAVGYEPWLAADFVVPAAGERPELVIAKLSSAAVAAGITLHVHDQALRPLDNVRVEAFALDAANRDGAWQDGKPLWSRRTAAPDGRYTLPTLAPGDYGIRVFAVDSDGVVLPFVPYRNTFALTGSNGFTEDVTLQAGCIPEFEIVDIYGKPLVPGGSQIDLMLTLPGGPDISRQWLVRTDGELFRGKDLLPGVGAAWPEVPVAAGLWQLQVGRQGRQPHIEAVSLRSGERQRIRVAVP